MKIKNKSTKIIAIMLLALIVLGITLKYLGTVNSLFHHPTNAPMKKRLSFNTNTTLLATIPSECGQFASNDSIRTVFSPDGRFVAYTCSMKYGSTAVLLNGKLGPKFFSVQNFMFSPFDDFAYVGIHVDVPPQNPYENTFPIPKDNILMVNNTSITRVPADNLQGNMVILDGGFSSSTRITYLTFKNNYPWKLNKFFYNQTLTAGAGTKYANFTEPAISKDGKHSVFIAKRQNTMYLVKDEKEQALSGEVLGKLYDGSINGMYLSNDASKIAYIIKNKNGKYQVIVNGKSSKEYYDANANSNYVSIRDVILSSNGTRVAYFVGDINSGFYVIDDHEYTDINAVDNSLVFSPDSKKFAFIAKSPLNISKYVVVENGNVVGNTYDNIANLVYSKDSSTLAYLASNGNQNYIVMNNTPNAINYSGLVTSDSFLYGEKKTPPEIYGLQLTPTGNKPIFRYYQPSNQINVADKYTIISNGKSSLEYDSISDPIFSPDEKYIGYGVKKGNELWWMAFAY